MKATATNFLVLDDHSGPHPASVLVNGTKVAVEMRREPMTRADWTTHDYNVHFCFGLENSGHSDATAEITVNGGQWDMLSQPGPILFGADQASSAFSRLDVLSRGDGGKSCAFNLHIPAGERIYIANTLVRDGSSLSTRFDKLAEKGGAERLSIGQTIQRRDLVAYKYGEASETGTVLVTSGFHPPEPDTLATEAIMNWLATSEGKTVLDKLSIVVVPIANPDGFALGSFGANAAGINFYWHFAREVPDRCPEAAALWTLVQELQPQGYIDFHSYTVQCNKLPGPYIPPLFFHGDKTVRRAAAEFHRRLLNAPGTAAVTGFGSFAPHTLGSMLIKNFDTITAAKYHLHLAEGEKACGDRGLYVFQQFAKTLIEHGLTRPRNVRRLGWRALPYAMWEYWSGLIRPLLGECRRGNWRNVRFTRTALDNPDHVVANGPD